MYYQVKDLPDTLQSNLKALGYHKKDLQIKTSDTFTPDTAYGDGYRAMSVAINLSSGESKTTVGDYGGGFGSKAQDQAALNNSKVTIPEGIVFLSIQSGPHMFVTAYAHPSTFALLLPKSEITLPLEEECVLFSHRAYKSSYRSEYYNQKGISNVAEIVQKLASKGFLKINKAGSSQITTEGKNMVEKYSGGGRGPQPNSQE
jgi:hypothetical protein